MPHSSQKRTLILAGGGTGGHVLAGIAVAECWIAQDPGANRVLFVGAHGGIEEKLVPRAGYELALLHLGTLNRVSWGRKFRTLVQLPFALLRSMSLLLNEKPQAVLGVGGYASGPLVLMARVLSLLGALKCRVAILEQNAVSGLTNRLLSRVVERIYCALPGATGAFSPRKVLLTGNPIRSQMKRIASRDRRSAERLTLFVFGGSQGALGINTLVLESLPLLKDIQRQLHWIHQTGERDYDRVVEGYRLQGVEARVEKFIHEMMEAYERSDLLICRAGSSTLSEIAAVGKAAVLIPFPFASDDHQRKNAEIFAKEGACRILDQTLSKGSDLATLIREFCSAPSKLAEMERAITRFHRPDAARDIAQDLAQRG